ncbi:MAG: hypothetical protein QXP02_00200 [Desulfurococcaceae archaeon]
MSRSIILVTLALMIISTILHMPVETQDILFGRVILQPIYNDFLQPLYNVIIRPDPRRIHEIWLNINAWNRFINGERTIILPFMDYKPYIDGYRLIAPPLHGFLVGIFIQTSLLFSNTRDPNILITICYILQAISSTVCIILAINYLLKKIGKGLYPLMIITMLVYGVYNIEPFALLFIILSMLNFLENKENKAILYAGLASSFSYFAFVLFGVMIFVALKRNLKYSHILSILLPLIPYLLILMVKPEYLGWVINSLISPVFNCSLYQFASIKLGDEVMFRISTGIWLTLLLIIYSIHPSEGDINKWPGYIAGLLTLMYTMHPQTVPQTLLLILPSLLLAMNKDSKNIFLLILTEALNAMIILLWFHAGFIASYLSHIGIRVSSNPLSLDNPVQWIAQARNAILLVHSGLLISENV